MVDFVKDSTSDFIAGIKDHLDEAAAQIIGGGSGGVTNEAFGANTFSANPKHAETVSAMPKITMHDIEGVMKLKGVDEETFFVIRSGWDNTTDIHRFDRKSNAYLVGRYWRGLKLAELHTEDTYGLKQAKKNYNTVRLRLNKELRVKGKNESTKYEQFTDSYTRVDETVSTTAGAYRNIDGSLFETKDAANIAMGELGLSETHRIAPRRPNDVLEYVLVPNSVKRVDEGKSKEASAVLKLMDADEDGDYQKALAAVLKANPHADKKKLEKELDKYI